MKVLMVYTYHFVGDPSTYFDNSVRTIRGERPTIEEIREFEYEIANSNGRHLVAVVNVIPLAE